MIVHQPQAVARRRLVSAFRSAGAVSPEKARTAEELGLDNSLFLRRYLRLRIIRELDSGKLYLDVDALREHDLTILRWLAVPAALIIGMMLFAIASKH